MVAYEALPKSSYLDLTSYQGNAPLPSGTPLIGFVQDQRRAGAGAGQ